MAEIPQDLQGLRAGMDATAVEDEAAAGDAAAFELHDASAAAETNFETSGESSSSQAAESGDVKGKKRAATRPDARTEYLGVMRTPSGTYKAQIWDSRVKSAVSPGTFGTAVEAARAYDAVAVELRGAKAKTNFTASGELSGHAKMKAKKPPPARPHAGTGFHGVIWLRSGKYRAQIRDLEKKATVSLGTFCTAEEAARAYDVAAIELRGAEARTNFEQKPTAATTNFEQNPATAAADDGVVSSTDLPNDSPENLVPGPQMDDLGIDWPTEAEVQLMLNFEQHPTAAGTKFEQNCTAATADDGEVWSTDLPNDFPELPAVDFSENLVPGPQMDDLGIDWPTEAEVQLMLDFLKDFDQVVD